MHMTRRYTAIVGRRLNTPNEAAAAASELRQHIAALESELVQASGKLIEIRSRALVVEHRAMEAIRAGDDRAACDALIEQQARTEEAALLEADIQAVRETLAEWYEFLKHWVDAHGANHEDPAPPA